MNDLDARQRILQAAVIEFAEKGKAGARMDTIAHAAEVNKAMIYYYFSSKDNLFKAVLRRVMETVMERQSKIARLEGSIQEKIASVVDEIVTLFNGQPQILRLLVHETLDGTVNLEEVVRDLAADRTIPEMTGVAALIRQAMNTGMLRGDDVAQVGFTIFSLCAFHSFFWPVIKLIWGLSDMDQAQFVDSRRHHIIDLLQSGLFNQPDDKK